MFVFTVLSTVVALVLSAGFGVWSYLSFKSDDGSATAVIGSIVGFVFMLVSTVAGFIGVIGLCVIANRVWG